MYSEYKCCNSVFSMDDLAAHSAVNTLLPIKQFLLYVMLFTFSYMYIATVRCM